MALSTNDSAKQLDSFYNHMILLSSEPGFNKFFVRSLTHVMIIVLVASRSVELFSFEKICDKIPSHVASRSTIKSILDDGVKQFFLEKDEDPNDRRIQLYRLSKENLLHIRSWVAMQHKIFA